MIPEVNEILEYWAKFAEYDPNQHSFSVGNWSWSWHNVGKCISSLISSYDNNGYLACLYLKHEFKTIMKDFRICLWDAVNDRAGLEECYKMYDLLYSDNMKLIETNFRELCDKMIGKIFQQSNLIGSIPLDSLLSYLDDIVENLPKCREELLVDSGIADISVKNIYPEIVVFNTVAECMLALNSAADNTIYLCHITSRGSMDGYFAYIIKSNGNIISVNDRVGETYIGQHKHHRNGRWMEAKQYSIFPYSSFVKWSGSDYKGYATKVEVQVDRLKLQDLEHDDLIKVLLGAILLMNKFQMSGKQDAKPIYTISLISQNIEEKCTSLIVQSENAIIAKQYNELDAKLKSMKTEDILNPDRESNQFIQREDSIFVKLWSKGFEFDPANIAKYDTLAITDKDYMPDAEFLSSAETLQALFLQEGRIQLTKYIKSAMLRAFQEFGGIDAVKHWWEEAVRRNIRTVVLFCCAKYMNCSGKIDETNRGNWITDDTTKNIRYEENEYHQYSGVLINQKYEWDDSKCSHICLSCEDPWDEKAYPANTWFTFMPRSYINLQEIINGEELPNIVKGYSTESRMTHTNSILDMSDPVETIGCVFEDSQVRNYNAKLKARIVQEEGIPEIFADSSDTYRREKMESYTFAFRIGFSKREFKKMLNGNSILNTKYNITKDQIKEFVDTYNNIQKKSTISDTI